MMVIKYVLGTHPLSLPTFFLLLSLFLSLSHSLSPSSLSLILTFSLYPTLILTLKHTHTNNSISKTDSNHYQSLRILTSLISNSLFAPYISLPLSPYFHTENCGCEPPMWVAIMDESGSSASTSPDMAAM